MPNRFFPSAKEARLDSRNNLEIFREIRAIEEAILIARDAGNLEVTVGSTRMTQYEATPDNPNAYVAEDFYDAWLNTTRPVAADSNANIPNLAVLEEQMKTVMTYFQDLGYSIRRKKNTSSNLTFDWVVKW